MATALGLANLPSAGRLWITEADVGGLAGDVVGLDATAGAILNVTPPPEGSLRLREDVATRLGLRVGEDVALVADAWPAPLVTAAFEMDRVRPCDPAQPAGLCSLPLGGGGESRLRLQVPPGSFDLRYHPDVVELREEHFPAAWDGRFVSPTGERVPFQTAALSRSQLDPPGLLAGPLHEGEWSVEFTLDLNGTRAQGATAGFISFRTVGVSPFDTDVLRTLDPAEQTRKVLALATPHSVTLRVDAIEPAPLFRAAAVLASSDARALLGSSEGNATALVARMTPSAASAFGNATRESGAPMHRVLRARPVGNATFGEEAAGTTRAPAAEASTFTFRVPLGGTAALNGSVLAPGVRMLALEAGPPTWSLVPGAHWPNATAALAAMAGGPHLVLVSEDLAREAGLDPRALAYSRFDYDSGLGARSVFVMGSVAGGPPRTIWASAALVAAQGSPVGARSLG